MHSFFSSKNVSIFNRIVKRTRSCNDFLFFQWKSLKEIAEFKENIRQIKASFSAKLYKSSRFTPEAQRFHLPNLKIRKICTQASIFHPTNFKILKIYTRSSTFHRQELRISKGFRKPKDLAFRAPTPIELPREAAPSLLSYFSRTLSTAQCQRLQTIYSNHTHFYTHHQLFLHLHITTRRLLAFF